MTLIKELYETNAGCRFPCWWGITPEKTDWATAKQFLSRFTTVKEGRKYYYLKETGKQQLAMNASYVYDIEGNKGGASFTIEDGNITSISIYPSTGSYPVDRLLKEYGQTPEIFIRTMQSVPEGLPPFYLIINYPNLNTATLYATEADKLSNGKLRGCFKDVVPELVFSPLLKTMTFKEMADSLFGSDPRGYPISIEEATSIDVDSFYQYATTNEQICIDTPSDLWP
jgi:hypothetical protein